MNMNHVVPGLVALWLFIGCSSDKPPDFAMEAKQIQEINKPGFSVRKIKHLLIYSYAVCQEYDVDYSIVKGVIATESSWNHLALSSADCKGLMQISNGVAKQFNSSKADLYNPYINLTLGIMYLSWLNDRFDGDIRKTL